MSESHFIIKICLKKHYQPHKNEGIMTQNCNYQELEQVVKVELVKDAACDIDEPYFLTGITETPGTKTVGGQTIDRIGEPDIVVAMDVADGTTAEMETPPTITQKEKTDVIGIIITHEVKIAVTAGFEALRSAINGLRGKDFHVVFTTDDGTRYLCYATPGGSIVSLQGQQGESEQQTLAVTLQSMNHIIRLI